MSARRIFSFSIIILPVSSCALIFAQGSAGVFKRAVKIQPFSESANNVKSAKEPYITSVDTVNTFKNLNSTQRARLLNKRYLSATVRAIHTLATRQPIEDIWHLALVAVWAMCIFRAVRVFGPWSMQVTLFSSEDAIQILMVNASGFDPFSLYSYGQDRWGAWPYLLARLAHCVTGFIWTDKSLYTFQTVWLFLGAFPLIGLGGRYGGMFALTYLLVICLNEFVSYNLFIISNLFAFQVTTLLFAWWCIRRLCVLHWRPARLKSASFAAPLFWASLTFLFSFLAAWTSPVSGPLLIFIFLVEATRLSLMASNDERGGGRRRAWLGLIAVAAGVAAELLLRGFYHRYARARFGSEFRTDYSIDWDNLFTSVKMLAHNYSYSALWPLAFLGVLTSLAIIVYVVRNRAAASRRNFDPFLLNCGALAVGACGMAVINFVLAAAANHVRVSGYNQRFLNLSHIFGSLGGILTCLLLATLPGILRRRRIFILRFFCISAVIALTILFPHFAIRPAYNDLRGVAAKIGEEAPTQVILGGYWGTYVFAGLRPDRHIIAVPAEGERDRMPWTKTSLRETKQVLSE